MDFQSVREAIDRHGWYVPCVLPDTPAGPTWAYTVGMARAGLPELLLFGQRPGHAYDILAHARRLLLASPERARVGEHLGEFQNHYSPSEGRLGAVARRWVGEYPFWAVEMYGADVDVLQLVLADEFGRFPDEPGHDGWQDHVQPDLSLPDRPWRSPFWGLGWWDDVVEPDIWALVPIERQGVSEERDEVVPAAWVDAGRARLLQPPILADHVTAGAEVEVDPSADGMLTLPEPGITAPTHRLRAVDAPGPNLHLSFALAPLGHGGERAPEAITRVMERFESKAAIGPGSLHVAVPSRDAERARIAFRRLERDGLLAALPPYHEPPAFTDHPDCPECRRARGGR